MKQLALIALCVCWLMAMVETPVLGYLDPGSGSMLLQVLLGGIAATAVIARLFWHRVLQFLGLRSRDSQQ
jgi:hypothetical protein